MNDKDYNSSPSDVEIILIGIAMAVLTGIVAIVFMFAEPKKVNDKTESSVKSTYVPYTSPPTEPPSTSPPGFYPDNRDVYCVGAEYASEEYYMAEDVYMLIANSDDGKAEFMTIGTDEENWQEMEQYYFQHSCIVKLEKGYNFMPTYCDAYSLDIFDDYGIENSPFENGGMFRVGIDVPAGNYRIIVQDEQEIYNRVVIYDDIDKIKYSDSPENNLLNKNTSEITLKDGEILDLYGCLLEKMS